MRVYSIFDDFGSEPERVLRNAGVELTIHPSGIPRPNDLEMKKILEGYDCVIIGTSQKITEDMFIDVKAPKILATASVGLDHIRIPDDKIGLVTIINTPKANALSAAEYTIGCALSCSKRLIEGRKLYLEGKNNKALSHKPEDLQGKTLGVVGAGNIAKQIMNFGLMFGMSIICWTVHPDHHADLLDMGVKFVELDDLLKEADIISVNIPNNSETHNLISRERIQVMKENAIFICISRQETIDTEALIDKAEQHDDFYICLDLDLNSDLVRKLPDKPNIMITPHIAGGTTAARKRMFLELSDKIAELV